MRSASARSGSTSGAIAARIASVSRGILACRAPRTPRRRFHSDAALAMSVEAGYTTRHADKHRSLVGPQQPMAQTSPPVSRPGSGSPPPWRNPGRQTARRRRRFRRALRRGRGFRGDPRRPPPQAGRDWTGTPGPLRHDLLRQRRDLFAPAGTGPERRRGPRPCPRRVEGANRSRGGRAHLDDHARPGAHRSGCRMADRALPQHVSDAARIGRGGQAQRSAAAACPF
jgi:hypothetical protein